MIRARALSLATPAAFALLAATLAAVAAVPWPEVGWAALAVTAGYVPSGLLGGGGWRRRAAEIAVLPAAFALTVVGDPTLRHMVLPPLLVLAAWAAATAAADHGERRLHPWLAAALAVAARCAGGLGLLGVAPTPLILAFLAPAVIAWGMARRGGTTLALGAALAAGSLPLERHPRLAVALLLAGAAVALLPANLRLPRGRAAALLPGLVGMAVVASTLAPWGGLGPRRAWPEAGWPARGALAGTVLITPWLPPGLAGAVWLLATGAAGAMRPAPPDRAATVLTASAARAELPATDGGLYLVDLALANAATVAAGTPVATVRVGSTTKVLRAGEDAVEWAHERPDVRAAHPLPRAPVWRPGGLGASALWGVAGRVTEVVPAGFTPVIERAPSLPAATAVLVQTAGPSRPTTPRNWALPAWLLATAALVLVLQLASGTWRGAIACVPWTLLAAGSLAGRAAVEPLRLLAERHAVDIALAALLAAWLPAARVWLARRRVLLAAAALLVPLALATPHLTPSLYGDEPFHLIVLDSLTRDHDLDLANNYDLEHHPYNRIYISKTVFLHSPVLAVLLLPGYLLAGRAGSLALLALGGAGLAALLARRARELGCPPRRVALLVTLLLLSYPLATFSSQIWVEVPGALATAAALVLLAMPPAPRRAWITAIASLAAAVKTRLGLVVFPIAVAAWEPLRRRGRELRLALAVLAVAAAAALAVSWATLGHPLGYRKLATLVPRDLAQPVTVLGGLIFDPAAGMAFAAPLLLAAVAGTLALWRRGGDGERAAVVGGVLTVLALLHSHEWYGGGSPPFRYLVPLLPWFALGAAMLLHRGRPRALAWPLVPPSLLVWWALVSRPQFSVNPGDGGWWLGDVVARRFQAGALHLLPSFLNPGTATWVVPLGLTGLVAGAVALARLRPGAARALAHAGVALWLTAAAATVIVLDRRLDAVVEIEEPQVARLGGRPEPAEGTYSRFTHANGWRVANGEGVEVPLNLPSGARVRLEGWLEGSARRGVALAASWDGGAETEVPLAGDSPGGVVLPPPPGEGRHRLRLVLRAPSEGDAVLDRVVVVR